MVLLFSTPLGESFGVGFCGGGELPGVVLGGVIEERLHGQHGLAGQDVGGEGGAQRQGLTRRRAAHHLHRRPPHLIPPASHQSPTYSFFPLTFIPAPPITDRYRVRGHDGG